MASIIGVMSDSHDNQDAIDQAVTYFNEKGADLVVHAGDLVAPFMVPHLAKLDAPLKIVYGNNEGERQFLKERLADEMETDIGDLATFEHAGKTIACYHGTIAAITDGLVKSQTYDLVVTGHTHEPLVERTGGTLHVNPGETCGYLTGRKTIAVVDLKAMTAELNSI